MLLFWSCNSVFLWSKNKSSQVWRASEAGWDVSVAAGLSAASWLSCWPTNLCFLEPLRSSRWTWSCSCWELPTRTSGRWASSCQPFKAAAQQGDTETVLSLSCRVSLSSPSSVSTAWGSSRTTTWRINSPGCLTLDTDCSTCSSCTTHSAGKQAKNLIQDPSLL